MRFVSGIQGFGRLLLVVFMFALGSGGALPRAASAQGGVWGMLEQLKTPSMSGRALKEYADLLGLTPDQRGAADELLFAYEREHREVTKRYEEITNSINEEYEDDDDEQPEVQIWRDVWPKVNKSFIKKAMKLDKGIMDDLKSLLDQTQLARWPHVERVHRRKSTLAWGGGAIDTLDLADIVRGLRLNDAGATAVQAIVEQYEGELDRELVVRNKHVEDSVEPWFALMAEYDEEKWGKMFKDFADVNKRVGGVNSRYRPQIQGALAEPFAQEFDLRVKQALYPRVYRRSHAMLVLTAAEKIEGLDAATLEGIRAAREVYERDAAVANEKWAASLAEEDAKNSADSGQHMWWGDWSEESEKTAEARKARRELDKRTVAAVNAILTEEQRKKLPDRKWRPEWDLDSPSPAK